MNIKKFFFNFLEKRLDKKDRQEVLKYIKDLKNESDPFLEILVGVTLGAYYYVYYGLKQNQPVFRKVLESVDLVDKKSLRFLRLELNSLVESLTKSDSGARINPGIHLLQQTLKSLQYKELDSEGREFWRFLMKYENDAVVYLEELGRNLKKEGNIKGSEAAIEAIKLVGEIPIRYL